MLTIVNRESDSLGRVLYFQTWPTENDGLEEGFDMGTDRGRMVLLFYEARIVESPIP